MNNMKRKRKTSKQNSLQKRLRQTENDRLRKANSRTKQEEDTTKAL